MDLKRFRRTMNAGCALLLMASFAVVATAQERRTLAGTWTVKAEAAQGVTPSGGSWSRDAITGTWVIEKNGDALTGTWTRPKGEPWPITGRVELNRFEFSTTVRDLPVTRDGQQTTERYLWRFRGENDHDTLRGTMVLDREGEQSDRFQAFTAVRVK